MPSPVGPNLHRFVLATILVVIVGSSLGLDAAMAVAFSLGVMEADAHIS
jgi:hypothetical protein